MSTPLTNEQQRTLANDALRRQQEKEEREHCCPAPYRDLRPCKMRSVLDGEYWCHTHSCYQWRPWEWREYRRKQRETAKAKEQTP